MNDAGGDGGVGKFGDGRGLALWIDLVDDRCRGIWSKGDYGPVEFDQFVLGLSIGTASRTAQGVGRCGP